MRTRALTLCLSVLGLVLASCGSSTYGLTVSWSFANGGSCDGAGIEQVRITIPGEPLAQSIFDCRLGQVQFTDFYPGSYQVKVEALDATIPSPPTALWTGISNVDVRTSTLVDVVLQPVSSQNAVTYLSWSFATSTGQAPQCGQGQRIDSMEIFVDNVDTNLRYGCADGLGTALVVSPYLTPGSHVIQLVAYNSADGVDFPFASTDPVSIVFATGQATAQSLTLRWQVGGLQVGWAPYASVNDYNADIRQSCAQTGLADLVLGFAAQPGQSGTISYSLGSSCNASVVLDNVPTGTWLPIMDGCGPGGVPGSCGQQGGGPILYREDPSRVNPPTVTVQPGSFFDPNQPAAFNVFIPLFHL